MPTLYPLLTGTKNVAATEHYLSAAAAARLFATGANAVDAAIAAALVEGVVNPHLHTIGGEAPMLIYFASAAKAFAINGNMRAPGKATIEKYRSLGLKLVPPEGLLAAGVPSAFDAFAVALRQFGTRSLREVAEPALELCEVGFPMHPGLGGEGQVADGTAGAPHPLTIKANAQKFLKEWPSTARLYMPGGKVPASGTLIQNPALAKFFRCLLDAEAGTSTRDAGIEAARRRFYSGDIAREIVAWSERNGGLLADDDLAEFDTKIEEPVTTSFRGVDVFKCGPWSQGPVFLQQLTLLESSELRKLGHNSADYIHLLIEASKLAFADREAYYADPEYTDVPITALLSAEYASIRRPLIDMRKASMELRPGDPIRKRPLLDGDFQARAWGGGTTHVAATDRSGNMIAITASGGWIPSSPVIDDLGFPLGSRMQSFYLDEKHPNALRPRKRPRTTLSPSMAIKNGKPLMAFGTPGGDQQDQWTLQFFLNAVEFGMNLQEAIEAPKFSTAHFPSTFYPHSSRAGVLRIESRVDAGIRADLEERGHKVELRPAYCEGHVLAVAIDSARGVLMAGCDPRGQLASVMPAAVTGW